ncbi:alpha-galactosidase [Actinotalea sp. AC32]|nr:alpha-galactosidase [Actinotalea sp. AC32]
MTTSPPAPTTVDAPPPHHLRAGGTSLVLDVPWPHLPRVLHWGADLGDLDDDALVALRLASEPQVVSSQLDEAVPVAVVPEQWAGWLGTPGLSGHRDGRDFSPALVVRDVRVVPGEDPVAHRVVTEAADDDAGLALTLEVELTTSGLVRTRATVTSTGPGTYTLDGLLTALPVPAHATEILDFTGRHLRERSPQRHAFTSGTHLRDNRRGRTGADATLLLVAGTPGFSFRAGEVWGVHVAWSGNHRTYAERITTGEALLGGGELLLPGEVALATGDSYTGPWLYASHGEGLDELSARFHDHLRARPSHPRTARPVVLNTWEAVYFDHRLDVLTELADAAAEVGVERFVLDDGWFRGRRDDTAGLGDWYVDEDVWPDGLGPLVDHVRGLGMQFGLWFEPEMVNPDSDLARTHPEWVLSPRGRLPRAARSQQVLDLGNPDAYAHVLERLDAIIGEYAVDYVKWDHNRDLVEPGSPMTGRAGVHRQTLATYRLMDELRRRHPALEIESCSSGGARVDLGVLERTDRVWASDCIDAVERQQIDLWTGLLLPPELVGSHIGSPVSHSTGRRLTLPFRAATAMFGHLGVEWDLRTASPQERAELAAWIGTHKEHRELLHTGRVVHGDHADPALLVRGVVAHDRSEALYSLASVATSVGAPPGRVRLPGLDDDARYRVTPLAGDVVRHGPHQRTAPWWEAGGVTLTGRVLADVGVQAPAQHPERVALVHARRV